MFTINSIKIDVEPSGIYGDGQFIKDGKEHNKIYVELCSDKDCTQKIATKEAEIAISGNDADL